MQDFFEFYIMNFINGDTPPPPPPSEKYYVTKQGEYYMTKQGEYYVTQDDNNE